MTTNTQRSTTYEAGTTVHVAPTDLLLQRNIRTVPRDDAFKDLVRSIAEVGVLEPIVAVTTDTGEGTPALLVRFGERRTLAAIEAKRDTVPVYIAGADSTENDAEVVRIITQRDENTHRTGLTTAEEVGVVEQLAAFGLSAAQIAKKARIKRDTVDTALAVSGSKIARKATERYDTLTLDQAAVVATFEDDPETIKALVVAAHEGTFEHVAQQARDARDEAQARQDVLATLAKNNVTVIDRPGYDDKRTKPLTSLVVSATERTFLNQTDHTGCPGHVAWLGTEWVRVDRDGNTVTPPAEPTIEEPEAPYDIEEYEEYRYLTENPDDAEVDGIPANPRDEVDATVLAAYDDAFAAFSAEYDAYRAHVERFNAETRRVQRPAPVYGCRDWSKHGHHYPYAYTSGTSTKPKAADMSEEEREKAKTARKLVVENNKAWAATQPVRRDWIAATLAKAKTPPKGTAAFIASALCKDSHVVSSTGGNHLAAEWLGKKSTGYGNTDLSPAKSTTENRALVLALVQVLGGYEDAIADNSWRSDGTNNGVGRYLRFLQSAGYTLSDVEKYAISNKTA